MNKVQDVVSGLRPRPSRALLLAFDASPPFVDHVVFPALLNDQLRDITILVDDICTRASAVDAGSTRRAGIYYRLSGVRTKGGGRFHPKLICLTHDEGVHVLIGSANLTWSSWCRNLEIMDVLSFGPSGTSPRRAGEQIAEFLRGCREALINLEPADELALNTAADAVQAASRVSPESVPGGPNCEVLHSLSEPLLGQLGRSAPADKVSAITFVSPFHDPTNLALAQFAATYAAAKIRVVKDGLQASDFDGKSFLKLGKRLQLHETAWGDDPARPLHAKTLLMQGSAEAWLVAGSANLTSPAWLKAAGRGGNVELVTIRHAAASSGNRAAELIGGALFKEIPSRAVTDPASLAFKLDDEEESETTATLQLVEAVERSENISLRWFTPAHRSADENVEVALRSQDREAQKTFLAEHDENGWRLEIDPSEQFARLVLDEEIAVIVRIRQRVDGNVLEGTAWLQRADLLGQQPQVLAWRHQLRALSSRSSTPEQVIEGIVALVEMSRNAEDAFRFRTKDEPGGHGGRRARPSTPSTKARPSEAEILGDSLRSLLRTRRSETRVSRRGASKFVELEGNEGDVEDSDDIDDTETEPTETSDLSHADSLASKCTELVSVARSYATRTLGAFPRDRRLEEVTSGVLLHSLHAIAMAELQPWLVRNEPQLLEIRQARRDLWATAFGLEGWETGQCTGWFTRMATLPDWDELANQGLRTQDHLPWVLLDLAACAVLEEDVPVPAEASFAISMLTGCHGFPATGTVAERVNEWSAELAADDPRFTMEALTSAIAPAQVRDLSGWTRIRRWLPFLEFASGRIDVEQFAISLSDVQRRASASLLRSPTAREKIATIRIADDDAVCGSCDTVLAIRARAGMLVDGALFTICEGCNRLVVPIDPSAELWRRVMAMDPAWSAASGDGE